MWYSHLHHTVTYLQENPNLGGFIAYLIALSESLAIIGTVIPGSVTMTAIGALVGTGVLPAVSTIIWAIMGAFTGDFISYWVGSYYNERLRKIWPFRRYPHLLTLGEAFFKKHGGKSVVIGRFAGPVRSVVPLIAGICPSFVLF
jgi:membrane protein DedA with SNARE-associated domain